MENNASNYALITILSIIMKEKEIHPVTFHSYTFKATELNYNTHNKKLLIVFETFCTWHHYLEGLKFPTDIITDHKNLKYFLTIKILFW